MYGVKRLLSVDAWEQFQQMFEETGFEVYQHHELVEVDSETTYAEIAQENRRLTLNELMERTRDVYWRVEEKGSERCNMFLLELKAHLEPVLNNEIIDQSNGDKVIII